MKAKEPRIPEAIDNEDRADGPEAELLAGLHHMLLA